MTTYKMKRFRSNQNKPSTTINMSEATKKRTRCLRLSKRKMEGVCSRKDMCRTSQLHHQDTRWQDIQEKSKQLRSVEFEETSVEISDNENNNVDDENQVNNEKLEIKCENQPFPKTAVRTTRYG